MGLLGLIAMSVGCNESEEAAQERNKDSIMGKTTEDIKQADGNAAQADLQVNPRDGLGAYPKAYGFAVSEIAKGQIKQMLEMYRAEKGNYPKTHEEFMSEIIKKYNIELPVLPGGRQYQYDVEKHELIVVEGDKTED